MEELAGKAVIELSSRRRKATAPQSQVFDSENQSSMGSTVSSQPESFSKETHEKSDIFQDDDADSMYLSFSIDKDASRSTNVDESTADSGSSPEKMDKVNAQGKRSQLDAGHNDDDTTDEEDHPVEDQGSINWNGSVGVVRCDEFSKLEVGTKRSSVEAESSTLKKIRLNSPNEELNSEDNPEITTTADQHSATDENSDLFGDSLQMPTESYFSELEKSVLEQVSSILVDNSNEKDVEALTQGGLSMEHLLKSNNCPLCLKRFDKIVVHVKNCAAKKKVTTDKLFDAIKLQLKQHQEREAIGLPPLLQHSPPKKKTSKKKAAVSVPEGYDSSLELAKALSASASIERQEALGNVDVDSSAMDENSKKSAPIFSSASSSGTSKLKGGSSLLFNRSEEDRERIVTEKVAIVLLHSDEQDNLITESAPVIPSCSKMKENLNKEGVLWERASAACESTVGDDYYVASLARFVAPSSTAQVGRLLRRVSQLPGRPKSPSPPPPPPPSGSSSQSSAPL